MSTRRQSPLSGVALVLAVAVWGLLTISAAAQQIGRTPIEVRIPQPPSVVTALGRSHLVYELHLTNFGSDVIRLDQIEVLGDGMAVLATWSGPQLWQRISRLGQTPTASASQDLAPGARAIAFLWVSLPPGQSSPSSLRHRLSFSQGAGEPAVLMTASVPVWPAGPSFASPVHGGTWLAARGPSNTSPHRLAIVTLAGAPRIPQRFAVDWALLGDTGLLFRNDPSVLENWYGYDAPVYAVASGVVALVRDGATDRVPMSAAPALIARAAEAPGNVIVLDLGDGRFVTYAHLKAGSLRVSTGDRVTEGEALARIGNSGNTAGPHLHFQVGTSTEPLESEGLPYSLQSFTLQGRVATLQALLTGTPWVPVPAQPARVVTNEMPLENMVVRFGSLQSATSVTR